METLTLHHNQPLRVAGTRVVECIDGCVWITSSAGAGDVFLGAGESRRLAGGLSLVEALGAARIRILPAPSGWRRLLAPLRPNRLSSRVLSSSHEVLRAVRYPGRRHPLAG